MTSGYAPVNGLELYWESFGRGDRPLLVLHGGFGSTETMREFAEALATRRRVITLDLQGHGRTADTDRDFSWSTFGDDVAAAAAHLSGAPVDLLGYSLGAGVGFRAALQHPGTFRRVVAVSFPARRSDWVPEIQHAFDTMDRSALEQLRRSELYELYARVAPHPEAFDALFNKTVALNRLPYDITSELSHSPLTFLLVFADADSISVAGMAHLFGAVGGDRGDAGWDGQRRPPSQLAILPGQTHYNVLEAPTLPTLIEHFLSEPEPGGR